MRVFLDRGPEFKDDRSYMNQEMLQRIVIFFVPLLFALCFHEFAHGLVAKWRGDLTAERLGRLTMNPLAHADPIGTFAFPLMSIFLQLPISFGWAKPVPVDPRNLKNVRTDMFWIALAGPLSNILLAVVTTAILAIVVHFNLFASMQVGIFEFIKTFIQINLFLAFFNLIPLHPLDGGKVLARFLPAQINNKLEQHEQLSGILLMVLLFSGMLTILSYPVFFMYQFLIGIAI